MPATGAGPEVSIIAEMITPALLLLASGSLIATVLARIGRIVELVRKIGEVSRHSESGISDLDRHLLGVLRRRAKLAEIALVAYYGGVVLFVLTCLLIATDHFLGHSIYVAPILTAMCGVTLVLMGSGLMVAECRMAMHQLRRELEAILEGKS